MIRLSKTLSTLTRLAVNSAVTPLRQLDRCVLCLAPAPAQGLCLPCLNELPHNHRPCRRCAIPLPPTRTRLCQRCQSDSPPQDLCLAPWLYRYPVNHMIAGFKYNNARQYGRALSQAWLGETEGLIQRLPDALIPCPSSPERLRERGFNQSAEIAQALSRTLNIPLRPDLLSRCKGSPAQASLDRAERLKNLTDTFQVKDTPMPDHVALIDDVITTGATMHAMAHSLRQNGARRIDVWALARTP